MKKIKMEKGITLIALIITIIVLLILAIVTIGEMRNSGITKHSLDAKDNYTIAQEKEQILLAYSDYKIGKYSGSTQTLENALSNAGVKYKSIIGSDETEYTVVLENGRVYTVSLDGEISLSQEDVWNGEDVKPVTAESDGSTYLISNGAELAWFRDQVNSGIDFSGKTVKLTSDINLGNETWTPIGKHNDVVNNDLDFDSFKLFEGTFDGDGHVIKNINIESRLAAVGFFAATKNGTIKNLGIKNGTIVGIGEPVNRIYEGTSQVGGILGIACGEVTIENCFNDGVELKYKDGYKYHLGGIVSANVSFEQEKTAIVKIVDCYNTSSYEEDDGEFGAILGENTNSGNAEITGCLNIGNIYEESGGGISDSCGIVCDFSSAGLTISDCYTIEAISRNRTEFKSIDGVTKESKEEIQNRINNLN